MSHTKLRTIACTLTVLSLLITEQDSASAQNPTAPHVATSRIGPTLQGTALTLPGPVDTAGIPRATTSPAAFFGTAVASSVGGGVGLVFGVFVAYGMIGDECSGCDAEFIVTISAVSTLLAAAGARVAGRPPGRAFAGAFLGSIAGLATVYARHDGRGSLIFTYGAVQGLVTAVVSAWPHQGGG